MPIDESAVVWDEEPKQRRSAVSEADVNSIVWDDPSYGEGQPLEIDIVGGIPESKVLSSLQNQAEAQKPSVTDNMSGLDQFRAGIGKSLVDTAYGVGQQVATMGLTPARLGLGLASTVMPEQAAQAEQIISTPERFFQEKAAERRAIDADLMDTGAGIGGNVVGTAAQLIGPGAALKGTAAARALLPTTIRGNIAQGAALGALQPSTSAGDQAINTSLGGLFGGLGAGLVKAAGGTINGLRNLLSRSGLTNAERRAGEIILRESTNPSGLNFEESAVPGVQRTLGESTQDPGLMALENTIRARKRGAFDPLDMSNNAARVQQLQQIAGTDADMAAAIEARDIATGSMRDKAFTEGADYSRLSGIMNDLERGRLMMQAEDVAALNAAARQAEADRLSAMASEVSAMNAENAPLRAVGGGAPEFPVMSSAEIAKRVDATPEFPVMTQKEIDKAAESVSRTNLDPLKRRLRGISSSNAGNPAVQSALNHVDSALGGAGNSVNGLYNVRKYIDALMTGKAGNDTTSAKAATSQLMAMKNAIDDELKLRAPSFSEYLDAFKSASKPINRMEVGREVIDTAGGVIPDLLGNPTLTPAGVMKATTDLDAISAKATGFKKSKASDILTPDDIASIKAIQDDMIRQAARLKPAVAGSPTFERQAIGERLVKQSVLGKSPVVGKIFEHYEKVADDILNEKLAFLIANPKHARRVIDALPKNDQKPVRQMLANLAMATSKSAGTKKEAVE